MAIICNGGLSPIQHVPSQTIFFVHNKMKICRFMLFCWTLPALDPELLLRD